MLFIARHGEDHSVAPHLVNYRANIEALRRAGATRVLAVCTVGSIDPGLLPGTLAVPDQIIDYTWGRDHTFHEPGDPVPHVDFTDPYTPAWRAEVVSALADRVCRSPTAPPTPRFRGRVSRPRPRSAASGTTAARSSA